MFVESNRPRDGVLIQDARVHGGTMLAGTKVRVYSTNFFGDYEVVDEDGNEGSVDPVKVRF